MIGEAQVHIPLGATEIRYQLNSLIARCCLWQPTVSPQEVGLNAKAKAQVFADILPELMLSL